MTEEAFARAKPLREIDSELAEWSRKRKIGRPVSVDPLVNLTIRVRQSDLPKLRTIPGYQTKISELVHRMVDT